jgi:hypothetical protein
VNLINVDNIRKDFTYGENEKKLNEYYLKHYFNFLGSGWRNFSTCHEYLGFEGIKYIETSGLDLKSIYQWNIDIKTGYNWGFPSGSGCWSNAPIGVDIKNVWEFARLQFLPQMAVWSVYNHDMRQANIAEFKQIITDFIDHNFIGSSVHWQVPMEAAIRACNILVAYDIFSQIDETDCLDKAFKVKVRDSIFQHANFILNNLEISFRSLNGNHYFSNLVGLLFISAYYGLQGESIHWWKYAKKEFYKEARKQFFKDGSNYESSTAYHCLMTEMLIWGIAVISRFETVPYDIINIAYKAQNFIKDITKKDGTRLQIGDNDSGRLFKWSISGSFISHEEAAKKYKNLFSLPEVNEIDEYFDETDHYTDVLAEEFKALSRDASSTSIEGNLISLLSMKKYDVEYAEKRILQKHIYHVPEFEIKCKQERVVQLKQKHKRTARWFGYENFGLFFSKDDDYEIYVYIGNNGKDKLTGHSHNDFLHYELVTDREKIGRDPGTYIYTAMKEKRNEYRSAKVHNVPYYGIEPNHMIHTFKMENNVYTDYNYEGDNEISFYCAYKNVMHIRKIIILDDRIIIQDAGNAEFTNDYEKIEISPEYGQILNKEYS